MYRLPDWMLKSCIMSPEKKDGFWYLANERGLVIVFSSHTTPTNKTYLATALLKPKYWAEYDKAPPSICTLGTKLELEGWRSGPNKWQCNNLEERKQIWEWAMDDREVRGRLLLILPIRRGNGLVHRGAAFLMIWLEGGIVYSIEHFLSPPRVLRSRT